MKEKYTVDALLCSAGLMDDFIRDIPNRNLDGEAYRQIRLCHYEDGILLVSDHNVNSYCYIYIGDTPNVRMLRGDYNARAYGDANPKPETGKLHTIWSCGKWMKDGPWVEKTKRLLTKLIDRINTHESKQEAEKIAKEGERKRKVEEDANNLLKAWRVSMEAKCS